MPTHHLAQINIARLVAPLDDPKIAEFVSQLEPVNQLAESSPGFIWRLKDDPGGEDPFLLVNMSVWESIDALKDFTYRSRHVTVFRDRAKWFEKMDLPHYCLWWTPVGRHPTVAEGLERLKLYQRNGSSPDAFWFSEWYPVPVAELIPA